MGEERGDEDEIEAARRLEVLRPVRRHQALDPESRCLEFDRAAIDVAHPQPARVELAHQEASDPAVAACEIEHRLETREAPRSPGGELADGREHRQTVAEVGRERGVLVAFVQSAREVQHLVLGVDRPVDRRPGTLDVAQQQIHHRMALAGLEDEGHGAEGSQDSIRRTRRSEIATQLMATAGQR
jgi:hypothetical protein